MNEMVIDKKLLKISLSKINSDEKGYYRFGDFVDLSAYLHVNVSWNQKLSLIDRYVKFINQDIWNLDAIILKLSWQKKLWLKNELNEYLWMTFAQTDIDLFHVELRSIFDYFAKIITSISDNPEQVRGRGRSFNQLYNWLKNSKDNVKRFGNDLAGLVFTCDWFYDIKDLRDLKLHYGGFNLVFPIENRILFQIYKGWNKQIEIPEIMYNENVVDFELYAGLYLGYLFAYLEKAAIIIDNRLTLKKVGKDARSYHPGLQVVYDWIKKLI